MNLPIFRRPTTVVGVSRDTPRMYGQTLKKKKIDEKDAKKDTKKDAKKRREKKDTKKRREKRRKFKIVWGKFHHRVESICSKLDSTLLQ